MRSSKTRSLFWGRNQCRIADPAECFSNSKHKSHTFALVMCKLCSLNVHDMFHHKHFSFDLKSNCEPKIKTVKTWLVWYVLAVIFVALWCGYRKIISGGGGLHNFHGSGSHKLAVRVCIGWRNGIDSSANVLACLGMVIWVNDSRRVKRNPSHRTRVKRNHSHKTLCLESQRSCL